MTARRGPMGKGKARRPDFWLRVFRGISSAAVKRAKYLHGDKRARRELTTGAGGDRTTVFDREMEDIVLSGLRDAGNVRVITEERGVVNIGTPQVSIIVDPLDGSFNALNGIPLYAMSLALADLPPRLGNVHLGYIRNLVNGDEYVAFKGKGAKCNGRVIHTSEKGRPEVLAFEFSKDKLDTLTRTMDVISDGRRMRCLGTMALSMCFVASGAHQVSMVGVGMEGRVLDMSAGKLIVEEAGGIVRGENGKSIDGLPIDVSTRTAMFACANKKVLERILRRT